MKLGMMFTDVVSSLFKPPVTQRYPFQKTQPPERYRGKLSFDPSACTGCSLCVKDCPSNAISLAILDRAAKRYVLTYHVDRCTFCGQCVQDCKFKCIHLSSEAWELAALTKDSFMVNYGRNTDIAEYLEKLAHPVSEPGSASNS